MNTASPCIDVCQLDSTDVCAGCFRTRDEISRWNQMSDAEKDRVVGNVAERLAEATRMSMPTKEKVCGRCGTAFRCGPVDGSSQCWCAAMPHVSPPAGSEHDCLCPNCLRVAIAQSQSSAGTQDKV